MKEDIRWKQRYKHFSYAFDQLEKAVVLSKQRPLSDLEEQGMIQAFEYTHELAWNVLKDFLENQGLQNLYGSKDSTRQAFNKGLIENGEIWMEMIKHRNLSTHTYNEKVAHIIVDAIRDRYSMEFKRLLEKLKSLAEEEIG